MRTFDSSILKIDRDGNKVISTYLDEENGERLAEEVAMEHPEEHKEFPETLAQDKGVDVNAEAKDDGTNLDSSGNPTNESTSSDGATNVSDGREASDKPTSSDDRDTWLAYDKATDPDHYDDSATKKSLEEKYKDA